MLYKQCILGVPKKAEWWIFSTLRAKSVIFFTTLVKASSAEENDTKIIKFGWVILILCPFLEVQSFSNFAWFLWPMSVELYRERPFITCFGEAHWSERCHIRPFLAYTVSFVDTDQWASPKHHMKGHSRHNSSLIGRKNQAKFENDCVSRNGHRIKSTQPNSMILVSFSSVEDAVFNNKKNMTLLSRVKNMPFRFFWDTRYSIQITELYKSWHRWAETHWHMKKTST